MPDLPNVEGGTTKNKTNPRTPYASHIRVNKNLKLEFWGGRGEYIYIYISSQRTSHTGYWRINCWLVTTRKRWKRFDSQNLQKCFSEQYLENVGLQAENCVTLFKRNFLHSNNKEQEYFYFLIKFCMCRWQLSIPDISGNPH